MKLRCFYRLHTTSPTRYFTSTYILYQLQITAIVHMLHMYCIVCVLDSDLNCFTAAHNYQCQLTVMQNLLYRPTDTLQPPRWPLYISVSS